MLNPTLLKMVSGVVLAAFPLSLTAAESKPSAMLYAHGGITLNGNNVPRSSALFPGDLVGTDQESIADISTLGSVVLVLNRSLVQYQGDAITLKQGRVTISTSKALAARIENVTVSPAGSGLTDFEVSDVSGTLQIAARKGDLLIADGTEISRLAQGQETTRDDSQSLDVEKKKRKRKAAGMGPSAGAAGGILNSPVAIGIAGGAVVGLAVWVFLQGEEPASPTK